MSSSYADDTNARRKFALKFQLYNISVMIPKLIQDISSWMTAYFLKINPSKTEIILFSPPTSNSVPKIQGVFIDNNCIRFNNTVKLLGVHLDSSLSFDNHVNKTVSECWYHLKNIAKIQRYLNSDELKKLVHAIICSKLDYCNSVLYGLKSSCIAKLQSVQNEAARIVCRSSSSGPLSNTVFHDLHWLEIQERVVFKLMLLVHKMFTDQAPTYFSDILVIKDLAKRLLYVNFKNTVQGRRAFSYAAPRFWNHLPEDVRLQNDSGRFKTMLKTLLFTKANNFMQSVQMYYN